MAEATTVSTAASLTNAFNELGPMFEAACQELNKQAYANAYWHDWKPNDMVIWDNTGVLHRVEPYSLDSGRMMHRTTLLGEEAFA